MPTTSLKEQTKPSRRQAKFESFLSQGQTGIQVFFFKPKTALKDFNWVRIQNNKN